MLPGIPGSIVPSDAMRQLQERVQYLCHLEHRRFPGSQPVSFASSHLARLEQEEYFTSKSTKNWFININYSFWVCEKSDGIRVIMFICLAGDGHDVFLIDRKNVYRFQQQGFFFPHYKDKTRPMRDCLLDGELVIDKVPGQGEVLRFLVFDALVIDEENIMDKTLTSRYGRLQQYFFKPYKEMLVEFPQMASSAPFQLILKPMQRAYSLEVVLAHVPQLQHGTDGLIYTAVNSKYIPQTDEGILKWKPPHENSVDFKLELRFPELRNTGQPDFAQMPLFVLSVWDGGRKYSHYDLLTVTEDEWEEWKRSKVQYDDRVIEARWDLKREAWRFMRLRDDKTDGNHRDVVEKVVQTILDPVRESDLVARCPSIRTHWKAREAASSSGPPANIRPLVRPPPYNFSMPDLAFPGAPNWQGASIGYGFSKVSGPAVVDGWNR